MLNNVTFYIDTILQAVVTVFLTIQKHVNIYTYVCTYVHVHVF